MKKVLFIVQSNITGGAEIVLKNYLTGIANDRNLFLLTNKKLNGFYSDVIKSSNLISKKSMKRIYFRKNPFLLLSYFVYTMMNLTVIHRIVKKNQIEILYGNNSIDSVLLVLYKILINKEIKAVAHIHNMFDEEGVISSFLSSNAKHLDHIIVPSDATRKSVKKRLGECCPVSTVYNGIDVEEKTDSDFVGTFNLPKEKKVIAFVGTIAQRKRPDLFISIIKELSNFRDDFVAIIVGKSTNIELENELKERIESGNVPIKFIGEVEYDQMQSLYNSIDYLILTSDKDPLPTVILECMAHGKIVISRDVDGAGEMINHKQNGFLFPYNASNDVIAAQVHAILDLTENENEAIRKEAVNTMKNEFSNKSKREKINFIFNSL